MSAVGGIYVEVLLQESLERIWQLTQTPDLHQRWDLRFTRIQYLPRKDASAPQHFLYETRIGFGMAIRGVGETAGSRTLANGEATSALKFSSEDAKSLIREGSGYWRYVPTPNGLRFFTWYGYRVRFGVCGRVLDRIIFRPLMGWATAWSFDRLRLWADCDQSPETSLLLSATHAIARVVIAFVWLWHGLVPKLLFRDKDELLMLAQAHVPGSVLPWLGIGEICLGLAMLLTWRWRPAFVLTGTLMVLATIGVVYRSPEFVTAAFNPVTLNATVLTLCIVGYLASKKLPTATHCLRVNPGERV